MHSGTSNPEHSPEKKQSSYDWNVAKVEEWLKERGFIEYTDLFCTEHKIDGKALLTITEFDLKNPPLSISCLGDIKRINLAIKELKVNSISSPTHQPQISPNRSSSSSNEKTLDHLSNDFNPLLSWNNINPLLNCNNINPILNNYKGHENILHLAHAQIDHYLKERYLNDSYRLLGQCSSYNDYNLNDQNNFKDHHSTLESYQIDYHQQIDDRYNSDPDRKFPPRVYNIGNESIKKSPDSYNANKYMTENQSLDDPLNGMRHKILDYHSDNGLIKSSPKINLLSVNRAGLVVKNRILKTAEEHASIKNRNFQPKYKKNAAVIINYKKTSPKLVIVETKKKMSPKKKQPMISASTSSSLSQYSTTILPVSRFLEPEIGKLIIAYLYMFTVFLLTAFVMVIVHDRVPDMDKYPPLPDIMLDNLPYISWAFEACEMCGLLLASILFSVIFFHKHRFIILRRLFALIGTVFMLRCVTMLITSLSVPGTHLQCEPKNYGNFSSKLERAKIISSGFGMSMQGVRTCGDYMFSGHTVIVTLLNFFITEYTPRHWPMLHTLSWVANIFAIFFILAAHEHYSIDVFIAFYISSRLFLYYHSLANNRVLCSRDERTRVWFPIFSYFESSLDGRVSNEFEPPWRQPIKKLRHLTEKMVSSYCRWRSLRRKPVLSDSIVYPVDRISIVNRDGNNILSQDSNKLGSFVSFGERNNGGSGFLNGLVKKWRMFIFGDSIDDGDSCVNRKKLD